MLYLLPCFFVSCSMLKDNKDFNFRAIENVEILITKLQTGRLEFDVWIENFFKLFYHNFSIMLSEYDRENTCYDQVQLYYFKNFTKFSWFYKQLFSIVKEKAKNIKIKSKYSVSFLADKKLSTFKKINLGVVYCRLQSDQAQNECLFQPWLFNGS